MEDKIMKKLRKVLSSKDFRIRNIEKIFREAEKNMCIEKGGVIFERCDCGGTIVYTPGGVAFPICSKCGKFYHELTYKDSFIN